MKKAYLLVMLLTLGVIAWAVPVTNVQATSHSAVLTAQEEEPAAPAAQEAEAQTFTGQIKNHDGTYMLHSEDGKAYHLDDQDKAKEFDGKKVSVTGSLDEESMVITVSAIEEAEG